MEPKLNPSLAKVWLSCPKAGVMCAKAPDIETPFTLKGAALHLSAAYDLRDAFDIPQIPLGYPPEGKWERELYINFCKTLVHDILDDKPTEILVEEKIDLSQFIPNRNGIVDFVAYDDNNIIIVDYKTGFRRVYAPNNPQLIFYALGITNYVRKKGKDPVRVYIAIAQPSQDNLDVTVMDMADLFGWYKNNKRRIAIATANQGEYTIGDHCSFCMGRATCRAYLLSRLLKSIGGTQDELDTEITE